MVFVSATDESAGKTQRDDFILAGWVAREPDWESLFVPAWQRLVLDGPPFIPYLHMTEMRSKRRLGELGISMDDADHRIDESIAVIGASQFIFPIAVTVSGADVCDNLAISRIGRSDEDSVRFDPDYLCFLAYALTALKYVAQHHPDCERLDFVVERKSAVTKYIQQFHSELAEILNALGMQNLSRLIGELIPSGKERIPVQAADVLCWHTARASQPNSMDSKDRRRYQALSKRNGHRAHITTELVVAIAAAIYSPDAPEIPGSSD